MKSNGLFITFEGGDGAGKTTLMEKIAETLRKAGRVVVQTREPGGTRLGEAVRALLLQPADQPVSPYAELSLFLASRAQHIAEVIMPALNANKVVLCDRFNDSSIAYQGAGRGLGMEEVASVCSFMSQKLEPHLTFYLDIDPKVGLERAMRNRGSQDRIESEKIAFHQKIREAYHLLQKKSPKRLILLDAHQSREHVFREAMSHVEKLCH